TRITVLEGPRRIVHAVAFHPDSSQVVAAGNEGLFVWSARDGKLLHQLGGFNKPVLDLDFSPSGRVLAACSIGHVFWFRTHDWSRDAVATELPSFEADSLTYRPSFIAGSDELLRVHREYAFFGSDWFGARRGSATLLSFAPVAMRGSLVLAVNGDVHEL